MILKIISAVLLAVNAVQTANCQGTTYASRSAFESALGSSTTITFEDVPVTFPPNGLGQSNITASGVSFTHPGGLLFVRDSFAPIPATGKYLRLFDGTQPINISLPPGVTAFGADLSGGIGSNPSFNATLTANLVGGQTYAYNFSCTQGFWTFFGITFSQPIASLIYSDGARAPFFLHEEMLDNVTFGAVPEPSSFGLLTLGGLLLGWRLRRKR